MVFVQERKSKGNTYIYLDKSIRLEKKVFKISQYIGKKGEVSQKKLDEAMKKFSLDIDDKVITFLVKTIRKRYKQTYPFSIKELKKIEEMNLKYKEIKKALTKKDWEDVKERFVANFVFESNALEGNSLTLKNFSDIIFENKIASSTDLREVYDAKNSYAVFSRLFTAREEITEAFIIRLHKKIMKNIDERTGYKKIPNIILGRNMKLTSPENVEKEMKNLLMWYHKYKKTIYPLELAFTFHHKFEKIHPFADGNGRVGRMLLNYILMKHGYYPTIIRKTHRNAYLKTLQAADNGQLVPLMRFALEKAKDTYRKFFEVYYKYA